MKDRHVRGAILGLVLVSAVATSRPLVAQSQPAPVPKSTGVAKELVTLLEAKKLQAFALKDPTEGDRFVAVLHIPGTQLLVISAAYEPPTDIDIRLYQKDYQGAYADLNRSTLSKSKVFIEDLFANGLKLVPGKDEGAGDSVTMGTERHDLDGDFADPKKRNQKKISQEDYFKKFVAADEAYTRLLGVLIEGLKKLGV